MKHTAQINTGFVKLARKWEDMSLEDQKGYLSRHPKSKRKLTAKPSKSKKKDTKEKLLEKNMDILKLGDLDQALELKKRFPKLSPIERSRMRENIKQLGKVDPKFRQEKKQQEEMWGYLNEADDLLIEEIVSQQDSEDWEDDLDHELSVFEEYTKDYLDEMPKDLQKHVKKLLKINEKNRPFKKRDLDRIHDAFEAYSAAFDKLNPHLKKRKPGKR